VKAAKDKAAEAMSRAMPMSRGGSRRGEHARDMHPPGPDGWTTAGGPGGPPRPPTKTGDISMFGKISKGSLPATFAPGGVLKREKAKESGSLSRTASSTNMFSMLNADVAAAEPSLSRGSQTPSRKPSADFSQGLPEPSTRKRLQLLPRSVPKRDGDSPVTDSPAKGNSDSEREEGEISEDDGSGLMSKEDAERKAKEDVKELFAIRDLDESEEYFKALPAEHHAILVDLVVTKGLELKEDDAKFVASVFARADERNLCSATSFEEGFVKQSEFLDDIVVDVPAAYKLMAIMMKGAGIDQAAVERLADKIAVEGEPMLHPRKKLLDAYGNVA
jgi:translation initiation factor 4G